jgi:hypothetical protein
MLLAGIKDQGSCDVVRWFDQKKRFEISILWRLMVMAPSVGYVRTVRYVVRTVYRIGHDRPSIVRHSPVFFCS